MHEDHGVIARRWWARTVLHVPKHKKPQTTAGILAVIDTIENRGEQNKVLRQTYLEIEKLATAAAKSENGTDVKDLTVRLNRIGDAFIRYNTGLAGVLVKKYSGTSSGADDIEAYMLACLEAMWLAFTTWDPAQSTFGTWSRKAIEGALWREVHFHKRPHRKYYEELMLRASVNHADGLKSVLGREPTDEEIAQAAGITVAQLREVRRRPNLSLDRGSPDDGSSLLERLEDPNSTSWGSEDSDGLSILNGLAEAEDGDTVWLSALAKATADLDGLSLYLVFARTGLHGWTPENLPEIAAATGIGREIVRRKTHKALEAVQTAGKQLPAILK